MIPKRRWSPFKWNFCVWLYLADLSVRICLVDKNWATKRRVTEQVMAADIYMRQEDGSYIPVNLWKPWQGDVAQANSKLSQKPDDPGLAVRAHALDMGLTLARKIHWETWMATVLYALDDEQPATLMEVEELNVAWGPVLHWPNTPGQRLLNWILFDLDTDMTGEEIAATYPRVGREYVLEQLRADWPEPDWDRRIAWFTEIWDELPSLRRRELYDYDPVATSLAEWL